MILPDGFLADLPENLSRPALRDLIGILRASKKNHGLRVARESRDRLVERCRAIECGHATGHQREDVVPKQPTLFVNETPWVIAFHPETLVVKRILYGGRDFPALFG